MASQHSPQLRKKTRIVCISDTHNQTPKLPKGDVLIHAGDLTNQGSRSELEKTINWLEKADFEAKIVIAGNHEITLDKPFYEKHGSSWRWPEPQDPVSNRKLLQESPSITYLENQSASIYLNSPNGPHTQFTVFGSPCTPNRRTWAFRYEPGGEEAVRLWDAIPPETDIVVTHTPPRGYCDQTTRDDRTGCEVLIKALHRVRPMLTVFGHIHECRGVERVLWNNDVLHEGRLVDSIDVWRDPGLGNNKQSLVDLTAKGGRPLNNCGGSSSPRQRPPSLASAIPMGVDGGEPRAYVVLHSETDSSRQKGVTDDANNEAGGKAASRGADEHALPSDIGSTARRETAMVNAAHCGPRGGLPQYFKVVVVDIELAVW
ncbi:Metallo-dependent phosphatase [Lophiostoma macrostomum CBS 122681]|uniref:Metallo-dependent phosphatase n=1 Tax=Lophiostoma macrostomum CBS 122681 TaxID=1314788 RepID=A0A6A6TA90_9PLEO|nr:Metallo-dependent phosphatase [Lophiostoma macrostomum CBS 122681]